MPRKALQHNFRADSSFNAKSIAWVESALKDKVSASRLDEIGLIISEVSLNILEHSVFRVKKKQLFATHNALLDSKAFCALKMQTITLNLHIKPKLAFITFIYPYKPIYKCAKLDSRAESKQESALESSGGRGLKIIALYGAKLHKRRILRTKAMLTLQVPLL